jgi:hypothetical protein
MMDENLRKKLDEMRHLFNQGLAIARELNAPMDRVQAMTTAIGGICYPQQYVNNIKPSGVPRSGN